MALRTFLLCAALALLPAVSRAADDDPEARGDRFWARRAEGFAATHQVDAAIADGAVAAYEQALAAHPESLPVRFKLVEALYFAGHFTDRDPDVARQRFERAVEVADDACARVAKAGGTAPEAIDAHFWAAISWGIWGLTHHPLAAAMHDVAGKIRDHATQVAALDPAYRDAAGWRILGRLHVQVPRVPMVTDWADREQGIAFLRKANAASDRDPRNPLFLAEALLAEHPQERPEALALLRAVAARAPRPDQLVEDTEMIEEARRVLAEQEAP
jgi:tetratricopeptide (TPR) repeat protein